MIFVIFVYNIFLYKNKVNPLNNVYGYYSRLRFLVLALSCFNRSNVFSTDSATDGRVGRPYVLKTKQINLGFYYGFDTAFLPL